MNLKKNTRFTNAKITTKIHSSRYSGHPSWSLPRPFPCVWPPDFSTQPAMERTQGGVFQWLPRESRTQCQDHRTRRARPFQVIHLKRKGIFFMRQFCQKKKRVWWWRISRKMLWSTLFFVVFWGVQLVGWLIFQDSSNLSPKCFKKTHPSA